MNEITPTPGNPAVARTAPAQSPLNAGAVRKPTIDCPECKGKGVVYFYRTLDPYEKQKSDDCEECGGTGEVPEPEVEEEE